MAAPVATARGNPSGIKLKDGYRSLVTIAGRTTISLWEKTVRPPGVDGGEKIPQTTMHNTTYRTFAPQALKELTDSQFTAAYDPAVLTDIVAAINVETTITVTFADGSTWAFFGYLQKFEPNELTPGQQPEATCMIVTTNWDHANKVEAGPTITSVAGT